MPSIVDKSSVKMVCVDDFALRKRFSYGTVMINLENHRIVDMIPSRDTNDVCNWLKTFHNIEGCTLGSDPNVVNLAST